MATKTCFVAATDTDAGKTYISSMLLQGFRALDIPAVGVKPIAAGTNGEGLNGDALLLQRHSGIALPYEVVNPICYQAPVAPHLAAVNEQQPIDETQLNQALAAWQQLPVQQLLVEGDTQVRVGSRALDILDARDAVYANARARRPERWSRETRDWSPVQTVTLNPVPNMEVRTGA